MGTRIAFVADVHLGNHKRHGGLRVASLNARCREGLDVLRRAVERALALKCGAFVVLGDLFDAQKPEPQLLAEVQRIFKPCAPAMSILLLVGNHDQVSDAAGDHALGPLAPYCTIVDHPTVWRAAGAHVEVALVPFRAGAPASEWLSDAVRSVLPPRASSAGPDRILGVHLGVRDATTAPWLRDAPDAVDAEALGALAAELSVVDVFAGNWHDRRRWRFDRCGVFQLGALVPTGGDNPGDSGYGTLAVWDNGEVSWEEIPGPRFMNLHGMESLKCFLSRT